MRSKLFSLAAAFILAGVAGATRGYAQDAIKAHVPFAFEVSRSTLPAGDYTITKLLASAWVVQNDEGRQAVTTLAGPEGRNEDAEPAKLVFERVAGRYFLSELRCLGQTIAIPPSKEERALQREMARNGSNPEALYVLASTR
jgi:hypothetical protein